ncbi:universal stress protein [Halobacterium jilantaiense]|uniref:Nucleotide-binding universal stress protein, UspA family n=1 Tax=Halobacterium jilantaiense TaxID=355548 RepID=A0A1I0NI47_9EURY|nr:universal stress protein [Halobacterium jilantaiense]SEW00489.1 Nucleotide-binding universal stress protein, UspA family [Halobacterium jilantaiense]
MSTHTNTTTSDADPTDAAASATPSSLFDRVLVVTDGGDAGDAAAETAVRLAARHDASVDALFVVDTATHWDVVVEREENAGENAVETVADRGAAFGVDVRKRFRYGHAHQEVLDYADVHDADLVVVSSTKPTGLDRLVAPDTLAPRVQREADVPVMVVGPNDA